MIPLDNVVLIVGLGIVLGFAVAAVRAPIRFRFNNWHSADAGFEPLERDRLAPDVTRIIAELDNLGFVFRGCWRNTGHSIATGNIVLLEHPQTLDVAKVLETAAGASRHVSLLFQTRFEDGTEAVTANNRLTVGLPGLRETIGLWLPEVRDPGQLYRVHDQFRDNVGAGKKRLAVGPDPAAFMAAGRDRMLAHFVTTGYYYFDKAGRVYRPTWKGAVLMTWRLLRPIRPFFRAWRRRPTRKLLRELGIQLEPGS
jgi:hypothetical protein